MIKIKINLENHNYFIFLMALTAIPVGFVAALACVSRMKNDRGVIVCK